MFSKRLFCVFIASVAISACSIHPLPQDVTGLDTYQIVSKIRCEARAAVRGYAISFIERTRPDLAKALRNNEISFKSFDRKWLDAESQKIIDRYDNAAIAYDFTFDITEKNDATASADILRVFSRGPLKLPLTATNERERQNTRNFRVADTFMNLVTDVPDEYCNDGRRDKNWLYPITGEIGLAELIGTFLDLNQSGNLAPKEGSKVRTLADTIEFTTKLSGTANSTVELSPLGRSLQITKVGLKLDGSRQDVHKVIVAVALSDEPAVRNGRGIKKPSKASERAIEMLDDQIYRRSIDDRRKFEKKVITIVEQ